MAAEEEVLSGKRKRTAKKPEEGGAEVRGGGKARAPPTAYLGRLCRVKAADQGGWEPSVSYTHLTLPTKRIV